VAYVYFELEPGRRAAANLMTKDEARKIAAGDFPLALTTAESRRGILFGGGMVSSDATLNGTTIRLPKSPSGHPDRRVGGRRPRGHGPHPGTFAQARN
jgi:hypothetical protein